MTTLRAHFLPQSGRSSLAKMAIAKVVTQTASAVKVRCEVMPVAFAQWLVRVHRTYRSRQHLAGLSERLLADIGLSEAQRQAELRKPFWKDLFAY